MAPSNRCKGEIYQNGSLWFRTVPVDRRRRTGILSQIRLASYALLRLHSIGATSRPLTQYPRRSPGAASLPQGAPSCSSTTTITAASPPRSLRAAASTPPPPPCADSPAPEPVQVASGRRAATTPDRDQPQSRPRWAQRSHAALCAGWHQRAPPAPDAACVERTLHCNDQGREGPSQWGRDIHPGTHP